MTKDDVKGLGAKIEELDDQFQGIVSKYRGTYRHVYYLVI